LVNLCRKVLLGVVAQSLADITVLAGKGGVPAMADSPGQKQVTEKLDGN
jgi:hypothetical protein